MDVAENDNICFDPFLLPFLKWKDAIKVTVHVVNEEILKAENVGSPFSLTGHRCLELLTNWQTGRKFTSKESVKIPVLENGADDSLAQKVLLECGSKEPNCPAFIVKGRGLFVWGDTVQNTVDACDAIVMMIGVILDQRRQPN
ncbi:probable methylthioribulose-1-phosphate dehydratase [Sitodiplosis mosellana]|uniref:probable methylthioribulose-1-phosphate dehydratase n=1 Tax=Sitodiplosis mosellana TaxID=263140 RepID=UPI002443BFA4|nr:probable methylthioribulose-1-phosphate dehydratase [Sitodiplosis mosellana]